MTLFWQLASSTGILVDEARDTWLSGHVTDILELDGGAGGLLVSTETGGVWLLSTANDSLALSDQWDQPNVNRLAAGPDGSRHFFAACAEAVIYETDVSQAVPLLSWTPVDDPLPARAGNVRGIAVVAEHRILIAATDGGLYWSRIPRRPEPRGCLSRLVPLPPPKPARYEWKRAEEPALGQKGYFEVATASFSGQIDFTRTRPLSDVSVVAGGRGAGVFFGHWPDPGTLVLERGRLLDDFGNDVTDWLFAGNGCASVAVSASRPNRCYAACADSSGLLKMVLTSKDGGRNWTRTGFDLKNFSGQSDIRAVAGDQGDGWNNCITVMKTIPGVVALGWQNGVFLSASAGKSWTAVSGSPHLHSDVHVVRFRDTTPDDRHPLLIGSDGGVAELSADDAFQFVTTARSDFNRNLPTLQCYGVWPIPRQFYGTLAANDFGLIATGVQDNGNIYLDLHSGAPWRRLDEGDGGWNVFADQFTLVRNVLEGRVTAASQKGDVPQGADPVPITFPSPGDPAGLASPRGEAVRFPRFKNGAGDLLVAVAASGAGVYGLFRAGGKSGLHWELLVTIRDGGPVTAASHTGNSVHISTSTGHFFVFDTASKTLTARPVRLPKPFALSPQSGGQPIRIATLSSNDAFAILNETSHQQHYVLRLDGLEWRPPLLAGLPTDKPLYGLDAAFLGRAPLLVASTDDHVYLSADGGDNWTQGTGNLPRRVHGADVRIAQTVRGGFVQLSTFGRSVYRAFLGDVHWGP